MTTTQLAVVLVVIAALGFVAVVSGAAVLWGLGVALLTGGGLAVGSVVAVVLYDGEKN